MLPFWPSFWTIAQKLEQLYPPYLWYKHFLFAKLFSWPSQPLHTLARPVVLVVFAEPHYLHPQHLCDIPFCLMLCGWPSQPLHKSKFDMVFFCCWNFTISTLSACVLANGSCLLSLSGHGTRAWLPVALATCGKPFCTISAYVILMCWHVAPFHILLLFLPGNRTYVSTGRK